MTDPAPAHGPALDRSFFDRPADEVAPELLGLIVRCGGAAARVVEVEAYAPDDPASHSFIGVRPRNRVMFGPPGHLYVYRSYGVHWCANVVCQPAGVGAAVLLRAGEPIGGLELMRRRRPAASIDRLLCSGPGRLCAALGITGADDGADLCRPDSSPGLFVPAGLSAADDATAWMPARRRQTTRIGITKAADVPWRWLEHGNRHVSRPASSGAGGTVR